MNKYYIIPVTNCVVMHDDLNLRDHLWYVSQSAYNRDCSFREFVYGEIFSNVSDGLLEELTADHEKQMSEIFEKEGIPSSMILVDDGKALRELTSGEKFSYDEISESLMGNFLVTPERVVDVYEENPNYDSQAKNFFKKYKKNKLIEQPIEESEYSEETQRARLK